MLFALRRDMTVFSDIMLYEEQLELDFSCAQGTCVQSVGHWKKSFTDALCIHISRSLASQQWAKQEYRIWYPQDYGEVQFWIQYIQI